MMNLIPGGNMSMRELFLRQTVASEYSFVISSQAGLLECCGLRSPLSSIQQIRQGLTEHWHSNGTIYRNGILDDDKVICL